MHRRKGAAAAAGANDDDDTNTTTNTGLTATAKETAADPPSRTSRAEGAQKAAVPAKKNATVPTSVVAKLILFTVLMFSLPILVYFYCRDRLFDGNTTLSAVAAVITANVILFSYVLMAFMEGDDEEDVGIATNAAFTAIRDPTRQDMVAALGETTGRLFLGRMRDRMLRDRVGRQILRNRPIINSTVLDLDRLRSLPDETFGKTYVSWLDSYKVSPDSRTEVKYIEDEELAYVMLRYRQVHDFFHTLTGLGTTVEEELALKWLEATQTGLPVAILSAVVGPLRLNGEERERLFGQLVPWAVQCGSNAQFLLNVDYEGMLERRLAEVQRDLGILPLPRLV